MEIRYVSKDERVFASKKSCELYEETLIEQERISKLGYHEVNATKFYKIESFAHLVYFNFNYFSDYQRVEDLAYDLVIFFEDKKITFPMWVTIQSGEALGTKDLINGISDQIREYREKVSDLREYKKSIKSLRTLENKDIKFEKLKEVQASAFETPKPQALSRPAGEQQPVQSNAFDDIIGMN